VALLIAGDCKIELRHADDRLLASRTISVRQLTRPRGSTIHDSHTLEMIIEPDKVSRRRSAF
jgi:hypothetical protein